jgi:L-ascorbate metabolism protein UlaG (beta-lactamase superfamily)
MNCLCGGIFVKLQLIRNATMKVIYGGLCFLTDPYLAAKAGGNSYGGKVKSPLAELPMPVEEVIDGVDAVLVSHYHSDHFDRTAVSALPKDIPLFCQPGDEEAIRGKGFLQVIPVTDKLNWRGVLISRVGGCHGSGDVLKVMGLSSGYLLTSNEEPSVYWTGDTIFCDEVKDTIISEKPDMIITHSCGATWGDQVHIIMDEVQTAEVCKLAPGSMVVAVHMETVDHATVTRDELRRFARNMGIQEQQLIIPADGDIISLDRGFSVESG